MPSPMRSLLVLMLTRVALTQLYLLETDYLDCEDELTRWQAQPYCTAGTSVWSATASAFNRIVQNEWTVAAQRAGCDIDSVVFRLDLQFNSYGHLKDSCDEYAVALNRVCQAMKSCFPSPPPPPPPSAPPSAPPTPIVPPESGQGGSLADGSSSNVEDSSSSIEDSSCTTTSNIGVIVGLAIAGGAGWLIAAICIAIFIVRKKKSPAAAGYHGERGSSTALRETPHGTLSLTLTKPSKDSRGGVHLADANVGVVATKFVPDSLAEKAGMQAGDILVSINGEPVTSRDHAVALLSAAEGDVALVVSRKDKDLVVSGEV